MTSGTEAYEPGEYTQWAIPRLRSGEVGVQQLAERAHGHREILRAVPMAPVGPGSLGGREYLERLARQTGADPAAFAEALLGASGATFALRTWAAGQTIDQQFPGNDAGELAERRRMFRALDAYTYLALVTGLALGEVGREDAPSTATPQDTPTPGAERPTIEEGDAEARQRKRIERFFGQARALPSADQFGEAASFEEQFEQERAAERSTELLRRLRTRDAVRDARRAYHVFLAYATKIEPGGVHRRQRLVRLSREARTAVDSAFVEARAWRRAETREGGDEMKSTGVLANLVIMTESMDALMRHK
jgi:hypothetical protein